MYPIYKENIYDRIRLYKTLFIHLTYEQRKAIQNYGSAFKV